MITTTGRDPAREHAAIFEGLRNDSQRALWLTGDLAGLLLMLDQALDHGSDTLFLHRADLFLRRAAMLARCYGIQTPALQRAVEVPDGD